MLQGRHLVAQAVVGQGAEVIPPGVALGAAAQGVQRLLVPAEAQVLVGCLLILVLGLAAAVTLLPVSAAEGIVISAAVIAVSSGAAVAAGRLGLVRILDLLVGGVDLLHLPGGFLVIGIPVRMIFFCQPPVGLLDFLVCGVGAYPQYLIRIVHHLPNPPPFFCNSAKPRCRECCPECPCPEPGAAAQSFRYTVPWPAPGILPTVSNLFPCP